jgi:hypothetical protein
MRHHDLREFRHAFGRDAAGRPARTDRGEDASRAVADRRTDAAQLHAGNRLRQNADIARRFKPIPRVTPAVA